VRGQLLLGAAVAGDLRHLVGGEIDDREIAEALAFMDDDRVALVGDRGGGRGL